MATTYEDAVLAVDVLLEGISPTQRTRIGDRWVDSRILVLTREIDDFETLVRRWRSRGQTELADDGDLYIQAMKERLAEIKGSGTVQPTLTDAQVQQIVQQAPVEQPTIIDTLGGYVTTEAPVIIDDTVDLGPLYNADNNTITTTVLPAVGAGTAALGAGVAFLLFTKPGKKMLRRFGL